MAITMIGEGEPLLLERGSTKARSMVFTLFCHQQLPPGVEWTDPEPIVQAIPHKYLVYGREFTEEKRLHLQGFSGLHSI